MQPVPNTNEISLKEFLLNIKEWKDFLLTKWKWIVIWGVVGGALGLTYAFQSKRTYIAELTFALEEKSGGMGAYAGIASQFGIDMGKGESGAFAGDNIMELFKSRLIIEQALLTPVVIEGKEDLLLNRYIRFNELDEKWKEKEEMADLKFTIGQPREYFSRQQDSVLNGIGRIIRKKHLSVDKIDKKLSIFTVKFKSEDELFAKAYTEVLAKNVHDFYVETKTKKTRANVTVLQSRVDSVRKALDEDMYDAALNQDQNLNPAKVQVRLPLAKKQMNVQLLQTLYGELVKNLELSKVQLMREEPIIQLIDRPILPLRFEKPGKLSSLIIGGFLGGFFSCLFFIGRRLYNQIMENNS